MTEKGRRIDPHVHCRDGEQTYKGGTIARVLKLAKEQSVDKIFDMPNTDPPILYETDVVKRLNLVPNEEVGRYFLYMGATADETQLREAAGCYEEYPQVIGIKMFAGQSVGNLAIIEEKNQRKVYRVLKELGYPGVIAVHCEKEAYLKPEDWDPNEPITYTIARPKEAEIASVEDQIKFARKEKFKGTLHICHVSCPEAVDLVVAARDSMKITCGATPHHLLWSNEKLREPTGGMYIMNPPLRSWEDVKALRRRCGVGKIDWFESDHAPHAFDEKIFPPYKPGFPSLNLYDKLLETARHEWKVHGDILYNMTQGNIIKAFGEKVA